jgi:hypothetical protein
MEVCLDVDSFHWWQPQLFISFTAADTLLLRPPFCPFSIRELISTIDAFVLNGNSSRYRPLAFCLAYSFKLLACSQPNFSSSALIVLDEKKTHTKHRVCEKGNRPVLRSLAIALLYNLRVNIFPRKTPPRTPPHTHMLSRSFLFSFLNDSELVIKEIWLTTVGYA